MTDEELLQEIKEVDEGIDNLPKSDKSLSKEERRHKGVLLMKKDILDNLKIAREKGDKDQELYQTMTYGLVSSWGETHPYLMSLVQSNLRWNAF